MFDLFLTFDTCLLDFMHVLAINGKSVLTPLCRVISTLGSKGLIVLIIIVILFIDSRTRKYAIAMIVALAIGYIFNDMVLKHIFARTRPFVASERFKGYLDFINGTLKSGYSFPSGHVTGITAGFFGFVFMLPKNASKKYLVIAIISPIVMAFSRMYLMHHYPSDCLFGMINGIIYALIGAAITKFVYSFMKKHSDVALFNFILTWSPLKNK